MCGRYQLALPGRTIADFFDASLSGGEGLEPSWNATPGLELPVLALAPDGRRVVERAEWGLVPSWARRSDRPMRPLINARSETVAEKPAFRSAVRRGRVLVPVTGFYEWSGPKGSKIPHLIRVRGRAIDPASGVLADRPALPDEDVEPFLLAGISEVWTTPDNVPGRTFSILTTTPNELCEPIHDRMPVILDGDDAHAWLQTPQEATELLLELLRPYDASCMEAWPMDAPRRGGRIPSGQADAGQSDGGGVDGGDDGGDDQLSLGVD